MDGGREARADLIITSQWLIPDQSTTSDFRSSHPGLPNQRLHLRRPTPPAPYTTAG